LIGNINNPEDKVSKIVSRTPVSVRRPEKATRPKLYYKGAHQATLDPIAARRPDGDTYMWSEIQTGPNMTVSGHPSDFHDPNLSTDAKLVYDVAHSAPWGWKVSLYTWTKGIAAGAYLVPILLALLHRLAWNSPVVRFFGPISALVFLGVTGVVIISII
jgi:hypothetical protein